MPRPRNTDERRGQIIDGLLKVMSSKGYEGATVHDIARAAKLSPGLVHYHFGSKQEVLEGLMEQLLEGHFASLDEAMAQAGASALARLDAFIDQHLATGATANPHALSAWVVLGAEAVTSKVVRARYAEGLGGLQERLVVVITDGQRRGELKGPPPDEAAAGILAAIEGFYVVAATARPLIPHASAAPTLRAMARGLLEPRRRS
jgi:TetR/AcrR family transcriptional repressor of bet genes